MLIEEMKIYARKFVNRVKLNCFKENFNNDQNLDAEKTNSQLCLNLHFFILLSFYAKPLKVRREMSVDCVFFKQHVKCYS